jgi:hypothetical protein
VTDTEFNDAPLPEGFLGWWKPGAPNGRARWHLIKANGRSVCGNWSRLTGTTENDKHNSHNNCTICKRKFRALLEK